MSYYVYAHIDKSTQLPFYIGVGQGRRAFSKDRNQAWLDFVSKYAPNYEIDFIAKDIDRETAQFLENMFISKFGKVYNGKGCLLNWTDGGYMEGVGISIAMDNSEHLKTLTKFGKNLLNGDPRQYNFKNVISFLKDIVDESINGEKEHINKRILKKYRISSIVVPFFTNKKLTKRANYRIHAITLDEFQKEISKSIELNDLPIRPYVDFYSHRIGIYFDMIIQRSVWIEKNGERITSDNSKWYFGGLARYDYQKLLVEINRGKVFQCSLEGLENSDLKYIYTFKIETISP